MDLTLEELQQAINGDVTYRWSHDRTIIPLTLDENGKKLFKQFTKQGFGVKGGATNAYDVYSTWCSIEKQPEIFISPKRKYAHIEIDMIFTDCHISIEGQRLIESVVKNNWPKEYERASLQVSAGEIYSVFYCIGNYKIFLSTCCNCE
ncbi:MAG: hypothetical protein Q3M24_07280 [Candidatus Electrothrix aestuarii]|uniref:Uncharacterized protein n=1 Tax=Candidatus Electrothrix aestuarii TaxID=3062594 RepID=A0AAU8M0B6_9BACT|nr:hypothetical protein [Candidatus Electrothrix aestuarii]